MRRRAIGAELDVIYRELQSMRNHAYDANDARGFLAARITAAEEKIRVITDLGAPGRADGVVAASLKRRALAARNALNYARPYVQSGNYGDMGRHAIDEAVAVLDEVVTMPGDI